MHFLGFHMFYIVIGISLYVWFRLGHETEYDGNPLYLSLKFAWPVAALIYLPIAWRLFTLPGPSKSEPKRILKYVSAMILFSFITGFSTSGYMSLLYLAGGPQEVMVANPVTDQTEAGALVTYQTSNGQRFQVEADGRKKTLNVRKGLFGFYYWEDKKIRVESGK